MCGSCIIFNMVCESFHKGIGVDDGLLIIQRECCLPWLLVKHTRDDTANMILGQVPRAR